MIKETFISLITKYSDNDDYSLECWREIEKAYSAKSRYYHNLQHIEHMINSLVPIASQVTDMDTLLFAIYYHDIIYNATKSTNEHESALRLEKRLSNTTFRRIPKSMALIEATKAHEPSLDTDTNILLDLDLSILGQSPGDYKIYCDSIRKEYKIYPDFMYRKGRIKVLQHFLALDSIFKIDYFKSTFEAQAKHNIKTELEGLNHSS
ncbi:MAG: hypothetical protein ACPG54_08175 [Bizionia paragorgiae]|uniref:HD domain-containing protein n=1 Tax=Bizionia paragorgiae TaxID=283786 RepID=UPI003C3195F5